MLKSTGLVQCIEYNAPKYIDAADNTIPRAQKLYNYIGSESSQKQSLIATPASSNDASFLDPRLLAIRKADQAGASQRKVALHR